MKRILIHRSCYVICWIHKITGQTGKMSWLGERLNRLPQNNSMITNQLTPWLELLCPQLRESFEVWRRVETPQNPPASGDPGPPGAIWRYPKTTTENTPLGPSNLQMSLVNVLSYLTVTWPWTYSLDPGGVSQLHDPGVATKRTPDQGSHCGQEI